MRKPLAAAIAAVLSIAATPVVFAATVSDPVGDFLASYTGPKNADLDVTSFSVSFNASDSEFVLTGVLAGPINPQTGGFYVIGVDTGTGVIAPFASIGAPDVIFNQAIVVQKNGAGNIGATQLSPSTIQINGDAFTVDVPLAMLPSTGFSADQYGFNLWPRSGAGNSSVVSDFAPDNSLVTSAAPEPGTWATMIVGVFFAGAFLRRRPQVGYERTAV